MSFGTEPIEIIYLEMIKNIVRIYILRRKNKWMQLIYTYYVKQLIWIILAIIRILCKRCIIARFVATNFS